MAKYLLATLTGSDLVDASGRATGPEIARVYSRHSTLHGAYQAQRKCAGWSSCPVILRGDGRRLGHEDRDQLDAYQAGFRPEAHRPRQDPAVARVNLHVRVHPDTRAAIDAEAKRSGESAGQVVDRQRREADLLRRYIAHVRSCEGVGDIASRRGG